VCVRTAAEGKISVKHARTRAGILVGLVFVGEPSLFGGEVRAVVPAAAPAPVGPYTPGIDTGDYLYVSGQGAAPPSGTMASAFEEQVRQTLENVKAIVEAAGLTMEHVVYTQVYLEDIGKFGEMNRVYARFFPKAPPARATLGVARLPGTPVEMNAVAVRNLAHKKTVSVPGYEPGEPFTPGILTHDRLFVSAMRGRGLATGGVPADAATQVDRALDGMKAVVEAAGLTMGHLVFVNPYLTAQVPMDVMNERYARRFEFGNTPARATIQVSSLPEGAPIEYTGVAVRDLGQRRAIRPKNMAPSPTASPCVFAGDTLYCSAKSGFIPGPNGGVFASSVEHQLRQTMRNLLDNLEEADMDFTHVVAANVYLDDLAEFQAMNRVYAKYFKTPYPARTTVQQIEPRGREADEEGRFPTLEQVSLIAVRAGR
jgi:reactive intermediate/imine deaminase